MLAVIGCAYDAKGEGPGAGQGSGSGSGSSEDGGTTVVPGDGSSTTAVAEGGGSSESSESSGSSGSTTGMPPELDTGSTTEQPPPLPTARSCREVLARDPSAPTGVHEILNEDDGTAMEVHCEMVLDGGGWTLVARSAPGPDGPFGWGVQRGTLGDEEEPYSLGVLDLGLEFTEVLVAQRSGFAEPVENAYRIAVPAGFLDDYREEAYQSSGAVTVLGGCAPGSGPTMLRWLGYTEEEDRYFFRDFEGGHPYGLWPNGFRLFYDSCSAGGGLNDEQGALFVR